MFDKDFWPLKYGKSNFYIQSLYIVHCKAITKILPQYFDIIFYIHSLKKNRAKNSHKVLWHTGTYSMYIPVAKHMFPLHCMDKNPHTVFLTYTCLLQSTGKIVTKHFRHTFLLNMNKNSHKIFLTYWILGLKGRKFCENLFRFSRKSLRKVTKITKVFTKNCAKT
jgi:hypothetical protein